MRQLTIINIPGGPENVARIGSFKPERRVQDDIAYTNNKEHPLEQVRSQKYFVNRYYFHFNYKSLTLVYHKERKSESIL